MEMFSKDNVRTLPLIRSTDYSLYLEPDYDSPYGQIYLLSEFQLGMLEAYI
jgi:hypothetical protein